MVIVDPCTPNEGLSYHVKLGPRYLDSWVQKLHIWKNGVADQSLPAGNGWSGLIIAAGQG